MALKNKIMFIIAPPLFIVFSLYFLFEILSTQKQFKKDFDQSIISTMKVLSPSIANGIFNIDKSYVSASLAGLFQNDFLEKSVVFDEAGNLFSGMKRNEQDIPLNIENGEKIIDFTTADFKEYRDVMIKEVSEEEKNYILPIFENGKANPKYLGVLIINTKTDHLTLRTFNSIVRLVLGLIACIAIIIVVVRLMIKRIVSLPLENLTKEIGHEASHIYVSSKNLSTRFQGLLESSQIQANSVQKTLHDMEDISRILGKTKQSSVDCNIIVKNINQKTIAGNKLMSTMKSSVERIEKSQENLKQISDIFKDIEEKTQVIHMIVNKTELLSLNANIEASRAGAFGKGFSVVADEVGNLAKVSGEAAKDVDTLLDKSSGVAKSIIQEMNESIFTVQKKASEMDSFFKEIFNGINNILENTHGIQNAAEEQDKAIHNVVNFISSIYEFNQTTLQNSQNTLNLATELDNRSLILKEIMAAINKIINGKRIEAVK